MRKGDFQFRIEKVRARFVGPSGDPVARDIEIRINPLTLRTCRIAYSRAEESEPGTETFPDPPPFADEVSGCPFCRPQVFQKTPRLSKQKFLSDRYVTGESILFPNLFPYGGYSAVSLFDRHHFVEIGTASLSSYVDSFKNAVRYLNRLRGEDPQAVYMAVTQNHLPSAGGSLVHPHLQINADPVPGNHHRFFDQRCRRHYRESGRLLFSEFLDSEIDNRVRYIGATGKWEWLAAFAPEGFFEIWGILPGVTSIRFLSHEQIAGLCSGILNAQRFYRSLNRNGYNLGVLSTETENSRLELRVVMVVRANYAPWVRSDHTGFEVMLGDMATFTAPEQTAALARPFWNRQ